MILVAVTAAACASANESNRAAVEPVPASEAPAAATTDLVENRAEPSPYVGLQVVDMLFDLPDPLRARGERIVRGAWGVVAVGVEGGGELIFLDRRTDEGDFVVEAVLELPAGVTADRVAWADCHAGGRSDSNVVAVVADVDACDPPGASATHAWRVEPEARRFTAISADTIHCLPPGCEQAPGGVEGGVVGGVLGGVEGGVLRGVEGGVVGGVPGGVAEDTADGD